MNKLTKRISALLVMLFMMVMLIPSAVSATELTDTDAKAVIYVQVPDDWENPCIWAWDDDGNNAFDAWPGGETEKDAENEGWYYAHIPTWANHVIVNANEGSVQTEELFLDGSNTWITVTAADQAETSTEQLTSGDIPEYVEKFVVHAQVDDSWENPCIWAWSAPDGTNAFDAWPGYDMTDDGDGWYSTKVPTWVNSIIINANDGSVQTEDIGIDAAEVWVTVAEDGSSDFSYVDPNKEEVPNITVHVIAPQDWDTPCLWAWSAPDGTNVYSTWPGEPLEEGDNGWLVKEVPGWVNSVIVNGSEGSVQTADISVDAGKDIWLVVKDAENVELSYEEPATDDAADAPDENATETDEVTEEPSGSSTTVIIIVVVVIVIILVAAGIIVAVKKKK